eukprot:Gb_12315 [translate_table: standard]
MQASSSTIGWAIHQIRPLKNAIICRIRSSSLSWKAVERRKPHRCYRAVKAVFGYENRSKWKCPSLLHNSPYGPHKKFSEIKAGNCVSNPSSPLTLNYIDKQESPPNAVSEGNAEIAQEGLEQETHICGDGDDSAPLEFEDSDTGIPVDDVKMLVTFRSKYNYIRVLEVARRADHPLAGAMVLLLDKPGNIHSVHYKYRVLTHTYYDVFATLPPLVPHGTLGILGMGAGTAAYLLLHFWPSIDIQGWEIDPSVISVGRQYFGLLELERANPNKLAVHIGDALEANVPGGFSGIVVDLFSEGVVIPELQRPSTWQCLKERLKFGGRIMINCGGACVEAENPLKDGHMVMQETLSALAEVFPGEVFVMRLASHEEDSSIAFTGPFPDLDAWRQALPPSLNCYVKNWVPVCNAI